MIRESQAFGARLRAERERRGVSLDSISEHTKIQKAFLESLERGDFSKWPAGTVFRRAYLRDYASAIGLTPSSVVADFIRLGPAHDDAAAGAPSHRDAAPLDTPPPLVLTFDRGSPWQRRLARRGTAAAAMDAAGLLVLGGVLALLTGGRVWTVAGVLAFVYYPVTAVLWGRSAASRYLESRRVGPVEPSPSPGALRSPVTPAPVETVLGRLEAVVDPMLLTAADESQSSHLPHETTTH